MSATQSEFEKYATKHIGINSLTLASYGKHAIANKPFAMTPSIIEERQLNAISMSVFDRLMMDRIIFLGMGIDDVVANIINAQLLFLESVDKKKPIQIYLNSPGGSVYDGLGIYDVMQIIDPKVGTVNTGICASMAYVLFAAGEKGQRASLRHARFMQHQPMGGASGQASDIEITAREIGKLKTELYEIISEHSGQTFDKVYADCDRDHWMTAKEAMEYGIVDTILTGRAKK
jgi:ATP-dependent Clp protease protease subunit